MTTVMMMIGNIEYTNAWVYPAQEGTLTYDTLSFVFLVIFVLLMPILLINLLVSEIFFLAFFILLNSVNCNYTKL